MRFHSLLAVAALLGCTSAAFSQDSNRFNALAKQVVPAGDTSHPWLSTRPPLTMGIQGANDSSTLSIDAAAGTSGFYLNLEDFNWTYQTQFYITKPTAARVITFPNATGTVVLNPVGLTWVYTGSTYTTTLSVTDPTVGNETLTIPDFGGAAGTLAVVNKGYVASGAGTVTLTAQQTGQTFLLDGAAGIVYTLPAPVVGLTYNFQVSVSVTSNAHEIKTNTGTVFLEGVVAQVGSSTTFGFLGNGSSHVCLKMNGTTTGGLIGSQFTLTCVSATEWAVSGINVASGTAATPFNATP